MGNQSDLAIIAISFIGLSALPSHAAYPAIEQMPAKLETQFALSALPPALRDQATVHLLDPEKGYQLSRQGTSAVTCLVERTVWQWVDFRNDIYIPLCYDAVWAQRVGEKATPGPVPCGSTQFAARN